MKWEWGSVTRKRYAAAMKTKPEEMTITDDECYGKFEGSEGEIYKTDLNACGCKSFAIGHGRYPCKHMIRLAIEANLINQSNIEPDEAVHTAKEKPHQINLDDAVQKAKDDKAVKDIVALAYGYYHLYGEKLIPDESYDLFKTYLESIITIKPKEKEVNKRFLSSLFDFLLSNHIPFEDKRVKGGSLWILSNDQTDALLSSCIFRTQAFRRVNSSKYFGGRPAWYLTRE